MAATAMSPRGTWQSAASPVRVAALAEPATDAAQMGARRNGTARSRRSPNAAACAAADRLPVRNRPQAAARGHAVANSLFDLAERSRIAVACDLPSGVDSDSGALLSPVPALRPDRHLRRAEARAPADARDAQNAAGSCSPTSASTRRADWHEIGAPRPAAARPRRATNIDRGLVHCLAGKMPGAIALAAERRRAGRRRLCPGQHLAQHRRPALRDRPDRHGDAQRPAHRLHAGRPGHGRHPAGADAGADRARRRW